MAFGINRNYQNYIYKERAVEGDSQPSYNDEPPEPRKRKEGTKYLKTSEEQESTIFEKIATIGSYILIVITFPISVFLCYIVLKEYARAVFFRLGRLRKGARGPGLVFYLPCIDNYELLDLRTRVEVIPTQELLTKDSVTISVDAVMFFFVERSIHATMQISNFYDATMFIAQTTLRNIVGSKTLHELLTSREMLSIEIGRALDHATEKWGVRIERVELKDISLPESLQKTLASEAESLRDARAKIISAEGEAMASQALKEASDVMSENKITLQLRHLQILTSIASERNLTIVYPFPMEMMTAFEPGGGKKPTNTDDKAAARFQTIVSSIMNSFMRNIFDSEPSPSKGQSKSTDEENEVELNSTDLPKNHNEEQPKPSEEPPHPPQPPEPPKPSDAGNKETHGGTQTDSPD